MNRTYDFYLTRYLPAVDYYDALVVLAPHSRIMTVAINMRAVNTLDEHDREDILKQERTNLEGQGLSRAHLEVKYGWRQAMRQSVKPSCDSTP